MTDAIQYIRCNWCAAFVTTEGITALLAHRDAVHPEAVARVVPEPRAAFALWVTEPGRGWVRSSTGKAS